MAINKVLHEIQQKLKAPKGQFNSFAKYNYRSCEDIVEAVKKILPEGFCLTLSDEIQLHGNHLYVNATARIFSDDEFAGSIVATGCAREALSKKGMDEGQMTGTASSYARKYALNGLFAIDDTKDADSNEYKKESTAKAATVSRKDVLVAKLTKSVATINSTERADAFEANQAIKDLRDELHLLDTGSSQDIDEILLAKRAAVL